jgi:L-lactate dehydrogenase complex protein LldG
MDEERFVARLPAASNPCPHPGPYQPPALRANWEDFGRALAAVGGELLPQVERAELGNAVRSVITKAAGRHRASSHAASLLGEIPESAAEPHAFSDVTLAIVTAELAVAENGAVLLGATTLPERALAWLAEEVLVLVSEGALVPDLVTAQGRLPVPPPHYLTWVAGPSKTADIEQALVIGAHGPRRLAVLPYG